MPTTVQLNLYKFNELGEEAKEKAIEWGRVAFQDLILDQVKQDLKLELEDWGFPTDMLEFSLSHSQGDGVAFYGRIVDYEKFLNKCGPEAAECFKWLLDNKPTVNINRNVHGYHYSHRNTMSVSIEADEEISDTVIHQTTEFISEKIKEISKKLEEMGYLIFDNDEEFISETIEANEYNFFDDGTFYKGKS